MVRAWPLNRPPDDVNSGLLCYHYTTDEVLTITPMSGTGDPEKKECFSSVSAALFVRYQYVYDWPFVCIEGGVTLSAWGKKRLLCWRRRENRIINYKGNPDVRKA